MKKINSDKIFDFVNMFLMIIVVIICIYPFYYCCMLAFNDGKATEQGLVWLIPNQFTLENFKVVLEDGNIVRAFFITFLRTILGVTGSLIFNSMIAYSLSRKELKGRKIYISIGLITMYCSGGIIPNYLLMQNLGILDTFWVYILPNLSYFFYVLIFMSFFKEIPTTMLEAAKIDGANQWKIYFSLVLPLSKPVLATIGMFSAVYHWNSWMESYLYIYDSKLQTLAGALMDMINQGTARQLAMKAAGMGVGSGGFTENSIRLAAMVIATIPILFIYPFLQKYFVAGVMVGAVKE